jgi:hypothetical protein
MENLKYIIYFSKLVLIIYFSFNIDFFIYSQSIKKNTSILNCKKIKNAIKI